MEVFDINGQIISPLAGKTLYVAGDTIAYGKGSAGGYGKYIADKYGMTLTNEAVDGATLTPNITDKVYGGTRGCISTVVTNSAALAKADYILLEGGGTLNWSALESGIVQQVQAYIAPKLFGGRDAKAPIEGAGVPLPDAAFRLKNSRLEQLGKDFLIESEVEYPCLPESWKKSEQ